MSSNHKQKDLVNPKPQVQASFGMATFDTQQTAVYSWVDQGQIDGSEHILNRIL